MTMMVGGVKSKDRRLRECEQMAGRKATMAGQMITYDPHKKHSPVKQVLSPSLSLLPPRINTLRAIKPKATSSISLARQRTPRTASQSFTWGMQCSVPKSRETTPPMNPIPRRIRMYRLSCCVYSDFRNNNKWSCTCMWRNTLNRDMRQGTKGV